MLLLIEKVPVPQRGQSPVRRMLDLSDPAAHIACILVLVLALARCPL
jgi:hypothetical protein